MEFARELDPNQIVIESVIGGGMLIDCVIVLLSVCCARRTIGSDQST